MSKLFDHLILGVLHIFVHSFFERFGCFYVTSNELHSFDLFLKRDFEHNILRKTYVMVCSIQENESYYYIIIKQLQKHTKFVENKPLILRGRRQILIHKTCSVTHRNVNMLLGRTVCLKVTWIISF